MSEKKSFEKYATPISIAVAGLFIAIAIIAGKAISSKSPNVAQNSGTQATQQDINKVLTESSLLKKVGVKAKDLSACIANEDTKAKVDGDTQLGLSAGLQGTPHMVIISTRNGKTIQFPLSGAQPKEVIEKAIADEAAPAGQPAIKIENQTVTADDHIIGNQNSGVTVIEYSDIDCPFCKRLHPTLQKLVDEGKIAWVFRNSPIPQLHPNAYVKAIASECVSKLAGPEAYWTYLNAMVTENE